MQWNPSSTATLGVEWSPAVASAITLDSISKSASMSMAQTVGQVIGTERAYVGAIPTRGGVYVLEVYDNETGVVGATAVQTARPNEDVSGVGATPNWRDQASGTSNIYTTIDEATLDLTDYIRCDSAVLTYAGRMSTAALTLTGQRVLSVRLVTICASVPGSFIPDSVPYVRTGLNLSSVDYYNSGAFGGTAVTVRAGAGTQTITETWYYNPSTKAPWTIADITALDNSDEWLIQCSGYSAPDVSPLYCYQAYIEVTYVAETRIAVGTLDDSGSALTANGWNAATMLTPTGGAWTKDGAGRHLYVLRRVTSTGALVVPTLAGAAVAPSATGWTPTLDATYGTISAMGSSGLAVYGLIQRTTAPAESVDSQPYVLQVEAKVYNGQTAQQEFSNAGVLSYGEVRALVKPNSATGDLLIKCKRRSDNVQFGSTITWTAAAVAALPDAGGGWKQLDSQMATAGVLAAATQYYLEFSDATAADTGSSSLYWSVLALDTGDQGNGATFGGTTDRGTVNTVEADRYDLPVSIATIPTAPAGFTATVLTQTV